MRLFCCLQRSHAMRICSLFSCFQFMLPSNYEQSSLPLIKVYLIAPTLLLASLGHYFCDNKKVICATHLYYLFKLCYQLQQDVRNVWVLQPAFIVSCLKFLSMDTWFLFRSRIATLLYLIGDIVIRLIFSSKSFLLMVGISKMDRTGEIYTFGCSCCMRNETPDIIPVCFFISRNKVQVTQFSPNWYQFVGI